MPRCLSLVLCLAYTCPGTSSVATLRDSVVSTGVLWSLCCHDYPMMSHCLTMVFNLIQVHVTTTGQMTAACQMELSSHLVQTWHTNGMLLTTITVSAHHHYHHQNRHQHHQQAAIHPFVISFKASK